MTAYIAAWDWLLKRAIRLSHFARSIRISDMTFKIPMNSTYGAGAPQKSFLRTKVPGTTYVVDALRSPFEQNECSNCNLKLVGGWRRNITGAHQALYCYSLNQDIYSRNKLSMEVLASKPYAACSVFKHTLQALTPCLKVNSAKKSMPVMVRIEK